MDGVELPVLLQSLALPGMSGDGRRMTDPQRAYLLALSDVRSWHRWQIGQSVGDVQTMQILRGPLRGAIS